MSRPPEVERTRHEIGRGLRMYYVRESEQVYIECVSNQSIYVQSCIGNVSHGWPLTTVRSRTHLTLVPTLVHVPVLLCTLGVPKKALHVQCTLIYL